MQTERSVALVAGAGGFIGGWLTKRLLETGHHVRCADIKPLAAWWQRHPQAENLALDLRDPAACRHAVAGCSHVYNLAADMGGMGYIETHKANCMLSVLINTNLLLASREAAVARYFFASSACVYAADKQVDTAVTPLREADAYPAMPEDGYGWEKLFSERMCRHFREDFGLPTVCARYHNVYGPYSSWNDGREKAPAAICRKVIMAKNAGERHIEIWGDGRQTRSFMYIDDCIKGTLDLVERNIAVPVNLGSAELVTIDQLTGMVEAIAGITLQRRYNTSAPQGVRGRNSDNTLLRSLLDWEPAIPLRTGLEKTYRWIEGQISAAAASPAGTAS